MRLRRRHSCVIGDAERSDIPFPANMGSVLEVFHSTDMGYQGLDAVVHLAAIPSPGQTNSSEQFRVNTMSTYNVLEACRKLRITNVVMSVISLLRFAR